MDENKLENLISEIIRLAENGKTDAEITRALPSYPKETGEILAIIHGIKKSGESIVVPESLTKKIVFYLPDAIAETRVSESGIWSVFTNWKIIAPVGALTALIIVLSALKSGTNVPRYVKTSEEQSPAQEYAAAPATQNTAAIPIPSSQKSPDPSLAGKSDLPPESSATQPIHGPAGSTDADGIIAEFLAASFAEEALAADEEAAANDAGDPAGDTDSFIDTDGI